MAEPSIPALKLSQASNPTELIFEMEQSFTDGYHNDISPAAGLTNRTHPTQFLWRGGMFKPINVAINLAVGVQTGVKGHKMQTAQDLVSVLHLLYLFSLAPAPSTNLPPEPLIFSIGDWYKRLGYIEDLDVTYLDPWDIQTHMPMRAEVRFTFITDFMAESKGKDSKNLPSSLDWTYDFTVGGR